MVSSSDSCLICVFGLGLNVADTSIRRHFNGEESFDTGPMAPVSEPPAGANSFTVDIARSGTKL